MQAAACRYGGEETEDSVTPAELDAAYRSQVVGNLTSRDADMRETLEMLHWMDCNKGGRLSGDQAARTWVWSELHLDHADAIRCFKRPFGNVEEMRRALFEAWRRAVAETDLVICLGDVTVGPANRTIDAALAKLPGEKLLVAGNHDVGGRGKNYGFDAAYPTFVCETEPALLLTHEPAHRGAGRHRERPRAPARCAREGEGAQVDAAPERQLRADRLPAGAARRAGDGRGHAGEGAPAARSSMKRRRAPTVARIAARFAAVSTVSARRPATTRYVCRCRGRRGARP